MPQMIAPLLAEDRSNEEEVLQAVALMLVGESCSLIHADVQVAVRGADGVRRIMRVTTPDRAPIVR